MVGTHDQRDGGRTGPVESKWAPGTRGKAVTQARNNSQNTGPEDLWELRKRETEDPDDQRDSEHIGRE